jgi:high frequency lysogenization protein
MSPLDRFEAQVVALAGLTQGVHLALSVARQGQAEPQALAASLASVLALSADSPDAIYGGLAGVRTGLRLLVDQLRGQPRDADLVRIGATVMSLERRYARSGDIQAQLRSRLEAIAAEYGPDRAAEAPAVEALAQAYLATLSTLTPRIRVAGNPLLLKDEANIQRIRACLLAALRSAALWHQLGGRGWRLLLQRGRLVETAQRLLGRSLAAVH